MVDLVKIGVLRRKLAKAKKDIELTEDEKANPQNSIIRRERNKSSKKKDLDVDDERERKREQDQSKRQRSIEQGG